MNIEWKLITIIEYFKREPELNFIAGTTLERKLHFKRNVKNMYITLILYYNLCYVNNNKCTYSGPRGLNLHFIFTKNSNTVTTLEN